MWARHADCMVWGDERPCKYPYTVAFDFDGTLSPYRGSGPPAVIGAALVDRLAAAFNVLIISNSTDLDAFDDFIQLLLHPVTVISCQAYGRYRKPHVGMWEIFLQRAHPDTPSVLFYCGDAAGRPGDFADTDLKFAINIGVPFWTPEMFFNGAPQTDLRPSDPTELIPAALKATATPAPVIAARIAALPRPVCVVMVGSPASGKTTLARDIVDALGDAHLASRDRGTRPDAALAARQSVVVDNTHGDLEARRRIYEAARGYPSLVICHVTTPKEACMYLAEERCATGGPHLSRVAIHTYWKRRVVPTAAEAAEVNALLIEAPFSAASPFTLVL